MNSSSNQKELVHKAAAGDRAAFEELYRETCRSVYFTCLNILKDEQEAQDIAQDVYLTAFEQLGTLEDADKFKSWLHRIAANKSIKRLQKKKPSLPGDEQLQDMETEENENFLPEEYALHADKRELVLKIIQETCSDKMYQTILLHYFNEFSIAEIAEIMKCPEGTVKNRLSTARAKIREGVLQYEKKSGDKLYSVAVIPFLTMLFTAQIEDMQMPPILLRFPDMRPGSTTAAKTASSAKTGGRLLLKGVQLKIAVGLAAVAVVGGVTAAVMITNQKTKEISVGMQEGITLDVADAEGTADMAASQETDLDKTGADEGNLPVESENAEKAATEESGATAATNAVEGAAGKEKEGEATSTEESETPEQPISEENEQAEVISESTTESEQQYTYTDMSATMYAKQSVNVRDLPSTDGNRLGGLSTNQEVAVTGQCNETGWYRFEYNGQTAYVSDSYVSDTKIEVAAAEPANSSESVSAQADSSDTSSSSSSNLEGLEQYPVYTWIDNGDWFLYIAPDGQNHNYYDVEGAAYRHNTLDSRYPGQYHNGDWCFLKDGTFVQFNTLQDPWPQGYIDFMRKYYDPNFVPYR